MGGSVPLSESEIVRFLWAISPDFSPDESARDAFLQVALPVLSQAGWDSAEDEIDEFLNREFLDAPHAGKASVPYVSSVAWMVYRMSIDPFRWDKERTLKTPIREIYQYIRCDSLSKGQILRNTISDEVKEQWLATLPNARVNKPREGLN